VAECNRAHAQSDLEARQLTGDQLLLCGESVQSAPALQSFLRAGLRVT